MLWNERSKTSESEKILTEKVQQEKFDFTKIEGFLDNIKWSIVDGIQYGTITFEDGKFVKFWFLSHFSSDDGGTIYKFSDGTKHFYEGYHCCEVQFMRTFKNFKEFKDHIDKYKGVRP